MTLDSIPTPANTDSATRIEWAGERIADLCDGTLPKSAGAIIWNIVVGWSDICSDDERRQYLQLARNVQELSS